jgi:hypothetical protein
MCDYFDTLISPRTIARTNTNIIYLILKAISKGYEIINNVCVTLSNKFDPENCSVEDLDSVASLVGTERLQGSDSGLHILVNNTKDEALTLPAGTYTYVQSDDVSFSFDVLTDTEIEAQSYATFIAMSDKIGQFPVTEQSEISVDTEETVPDGIKFSCTDNENLQGKLPETDIEFRKRILEGYDGQDAMVELEFALRNLPYLFDCRVRFNNTSGNQTYDGITVPPYHAIIFFSGEAKEEIADIIARKILFPTVQTYDSVTLEYHNDILLSGVQEYHIIPFRSLNFGIEVSYKINEQYITNSSAKEEMTKALNLAFISESHDSDFITENDVYAVLNGLSVAGLTVLDVNLMQDGNEVPYINIPISRIPKLTGITYHNVDLEG